MGKVTRRVNLEHAKNLHNLCGGAEGKGSTALYPVRMFRKALEAMLTDPGGFPAFYEHAADRKFFGVNPKLPSYICPKCKMGQISVDNERELRDGEKEDDRVEACTNPECNEKYTQEDLEDEQPVGFKYQKWEGKRVTEGLLRMPKKHIDATVWTLVLLPILERKHKLAEEDLIEAICGNFERDGLPKRFENATIPGDKEAGDEWSDDTDEDESEEKEPEEDRGEDEDIPKIEPPVKEPSEAVKEVIEALPDAEKSAEAEKV